MGQKTYDRSALAALCRLFGTPRDFHELEVVADCCALVLHDDGVFYRLGNGFFELDPAEQEALTGYPVLQRGSDGLYGADGPLLPFPFTARQLWDFDRATGGAVTERFECGNDTEGWIAEQPPNVQELARMLLADEAPGEPGGKVRKGSQPALSDTQKGEVVRLYKRGRGMSVYRLARQFNTSRRTIDKALGDAGVKVVTGRQEGSQGGVAPWYPSNTP